MKNPRTAIPSESSVACCTVRPFFRLTMWSYKILHELMRKCKSWKRRGILFAVKINVSVMFYLHWISMPINHVLWTWMMRTCVAPMKMKLKCSVCSTESTTTHFNFIFCQLEFDCAMGEIERQVYIVTVSLNRNISMIIHTNSSVSFLDFLAQHTETVCCKDQGHLEASVCAPVCPLFVMDLMTCWELKLTRVKFPRLWSISTWLVVISIGDCLFCPQKEPEMSPQWDGVWPVEGNIRN